MSPGYARLLALLPVRHPMVLVDRIVAVTPGRTIETVKAVTGSEPCYAGLAAGLAEDRYAYPRSLVLESFGQSAALLWLDGGPGCDSMPTLGGQPGGDTMPTLDGRPGSDTMPRLDGPPGGDAMPMVGRLRNCRFTGAAFPGDVIHHHVRLDRVVDDNAFLSGESRVGDRVLLTVGVLIAVARPASVVTGE